MLLMISILHEVSKEKENSFHFPLCYTFCAIELPKISPQESHESISGIHHISNDTVADSAIDIGPNVGYFLQKTLVRETSRPNRKIGQTNAVLMPGARSLLESRGCWRDRTQTNEQSPKPLSSFIFFLHL